MRPHILTPGDQTKETLIRASELGARLWRQNVGLAWIGDVVERAPGQSYIVLKDPRPFRAGVKGMADTGGFVPVTITPRMVGQTIAVYCAAENKSGSARLTTDQRNFLEMVVHYGGRAGVVRSLSDVAAVLSGQGVIK